MQPFSEQALWHGKKRTREGHTSKWRNISTQDYRTVRCRCRTVLFFFKTFCIRSIARLFFFIKFVIESNSQTHAHHSSQHTKSACINREKCFHRTCPDLYIRESDGHSQSHRRFALTANHGILLILYIWYKTNHTIVASAYFNLNVIYL